MAIKDGDFIEIQYIGKIKEEDVVFDTTDEAVAKENDIFNDKTKYGPIVVCLGQKQLIAGLDKALLGRELGKYDFDIPSDDAFGKKSAKLLKLIPFKVFRKQEINPFPGLDVNIDGMNGTIRSVSGGRVIVDFNHPLSGRELSYNISVNRIVNEPKEKVEAVLKLEFNLVDVKVTVIGSKAVIEIEFPEEIQKQLKERLLSLVTELKDVEFKKPKEDKPTEKDVALHDEKSFEEVDPKDVVEALSGKKD
ncbi:MAG: peptidylprolyl isomerase [Nanoarchaeota archaeon]|nr:peptidylprolyl isomerase [Nanoarchaeota archaeon]